MKYFTRERLNRIQAKVFAKLEDPSLELYTENFSYPLAIYSDPVVAELERARIFRARPMMAAHASQIAEPNSYTVIDLNGVSVILTRQKDGGIKALMNSCRHRGAQLLEPGSSGVRGAFACPYHGWAYGNDGANRRISFDDTFGHSACAEMNLVQLPVEERHGFLWVMEDPDANIDVAAQLGPMDQALAECGFDKWHYYRDHVFEFTQNWKIMMDGLIDGYHVQFLHGATISPYFVNNCMVYEHLGDHTIGAMPRKKFVDFVGDDPEQIDLEKDLIISFLITPNSVLVLHPHHVEYWTLYQHPEGPHKSRVHLRYLTPEKEQNEKGVDILQKNWDIAVSAIINEDVPVGNGIQSASMALGSGYATLGRNEYHNQVFHRTWHKLMNE